MALIVIASSLKLVGLTSHFRWVCVIIVVIDQYVMLWLNNCIYVWISSF